MEKLDQSYLNDLVAKTKKHSSNAFAELLTATIQNQLIYLCYICGNEDEARSALRSISPQILHEIGQLHNASLCLPWICRICLRYCAQHEKLLVPEVFHTPAGVCSMAQAYNLPLTESQILIMACAQHIPYRDIGDILNLDTNVVKRYLKTALKHMKRGSEVPLESAAGQRPGIPATEREKAGRTDYEKTETADREKAWAAAGFRRHPEADALFAAELLEEVFDSCGWKPNSVPVEVLSSYAVYRKERFSLQRGILIAALAVFFLVPLFFLVPELEVESTNLGERGLPVYTIRVSSLLPVGRVEAKIRQHSLPVYEADAKEYTVEPTRNGDLTIEVALVNRQFVTDTYPVTAVDATGPVLAGSRIEEDSVILQLNDDGIGVDFYEIYAMSEEGEIIYPTVIDREAGEVTFDYPDRNWEVYIPDHIGNTLHLSLTVNS